MKVNQSSLDKVYVNLHSEDKDGAVEVRGLGGNRSYTNEYS